MTETNNRPTDMDLAALVASKICHDVIGPVGAFANGLEILQMDNAGDALGGVDAIGVLRSVSQQASARVQFLRFSFGAAGSAGTMIDLETAREISDGLLVGAKQKLHWKGPAGHLPKNQAKLLLNLVQCAVTALPRGGDVHLEIGPDLQIPQFVFTCTGRAARMPQYLGEYMRGEDLDVDASTVQAYYTVRLAELAAMRLDVQVSDTETVISALPLG